MSGSIRNFVYEDDAAVSYAVKLDESSAEASWAGFLSNGAPTNAMRRLTASAPRASGIQMRYVNAVQRVTGRKARFYIGNLSAWLEIDGAATTVQMAGDGAEQNEGLWDITSKIGEQRYFVLSDTELNDEDIEAVGSTVLSYNSD